MCTTILHRAKIEGSGKGANGWFKVDQVSVSYDHPLKELVEYALNIDFVNEAEGPSARVAVELSAESARELVGAIERALAEADAGGFLESAASLKPK